MGSAAIGLVATTIAAWWMLAIAPVLLVGAAFGASIIDGPGNIPFLRATRPHERPAMAGIYMTYRDVSQFVPVAVFSLILTVAELTTAFLAFRRRAVRRGLAVAIDSSTASLTEYGACRR